MTDKKYEKIREDYVRILDYLPEGLTNLPVYKRYPVAQTIGCDYFVLLEVTPKNDVTFKEHEKVYVGDGERPKVKTIKRRLRYDELTSRSKSELSLVVEEIVNESEKKFVNFFNTAFSISLKHHQLELLPKIGKKQLKKILEEREIKKFESFEDLNNRVKGLPDAKKLIIERVIYEMESEIEKRNRLFVPEFGKE